VPKNIKIDFLKHVKHIASPQKNLFNALYGIIIVYSRNHLKLIKALYGEDANFFNFEVGEMYIYIYIHTHCVQGLRSAL
jgi:hypothetical protein